MEKEKKLKLLKELEKDLAGVKTSKDVHLFYTKAKIILEKICGMESSEVKELEATYNNYNLSRIPIVMSSTSPFNGNYDEIDNQKDIEDFKKEVQNIIDTIKLINF